MKPFIALFLVSLGSLAQMGKIVKLDPALDNLLSADAKLEIVSEGHEWSEGPVWVKVGGYLLFSDAPKNSIYKWQNGKTEVFLNPAGYTGKLPYSKEPGSNGLAISNDGQLLLCEHGDRRISKMPLNGMGGKITMSDNYKGMRFNSPNDLVQARNGDIYFTDPPYGLPKYDKDPTRETTLFGVYKVDNNRNTTIIVKDLIRPNGVALSPDEKILYVAQSDAKAYIMAYDLPSLKGRVFYDATVLRKEGLKGAPDGLKVDKDGNVFSTGPGGVLIINKNGKLIGRIETGQATSNVAWGEDGSTLFITADMYVMKIRTKTVGTGF